MSDLLALRARALFAMNRPAAGVTTALERERALNGQDEVRANRRLIWQGLQQSAAGNADFSAPPGASTTVTGWLDLGRAALTAARNPFTANEDLADWRSRYPSHPANSLLNEDVLPELGVGLDYPAQIGLDPAAVGPAARRRHRGARRVPGSVAAAGASEAAGDQRL